MKDLMDKQNAEFDMNQLRKERLKLQQQLDKINMKLAGDGNVVEIEGKRYAA